MSTQVRQAMNSAAALRVGAEFSFAETATTVAEARAVGFAQLGNIIDITPELTTEKVEAEDSNRGQPRVVRSDITKTALKFKVKSNEFTKSMVKILFGGEDTTGFTQSAQSAVAADAWTFNTTAATLGNWYPITVSSARIINITAITILATSAVSVTANAGTDLITETSHGRADGSAVVFGGTAVPAGLTAGVVYYVRDQSTNTYKVAATIGGAAIDLTDAGTSVTVKTSLIEGTDFDCDLLLGRVRFKDTARTVSLTPTITATAVTSGTDAAFFGITPGQTYEFDGYGALYFFDANSANSTPLRWEDFSCQVTFDSAANINAKSFADMTFTVLITDDVGTQQWRNSLADVS